LESEVSQLLNASEISAIRRGCAPHVDPERVLTWAETVRANVTLLESLISGSCAIRDCPAATWTQPWLQGKKLHQTRNVFGPAEQAALKRAGAKDEQILWARYARLHQAFLISLLRGMLIVVGEERPDFVWMLAERARRDGVVPGYA
jgi:hypothetical protein